MDFFDVLVRYETRLWNHLDEELRGAGEASLATVCALRVVGQHPGDCRVQEVSIGLSITVGAASKLVDRLERAGFAVRSAHPHDRRSSVVELTDHGQRALAAGALVVQRAMDEHLRDRADLEYLTAVLSRLDARLMPGAVGPTERPAP